MLTLWQIGSCLYPNCILHVDIAYLPCFCCITFGISCMFSIMLYFEPCEHNMHCIIWLGVSIQMWGSRDIHTPSDVMYLASRSPGPLTSTWKDFGSHFVCCMHPYIEWRIWSLGSSCSIDGSKIEGHASLSSKHDKKHNHAHMYLRTPCHALSVLCLLSNCLLQEVSADRQNLVPTGNLWSADESNKCRWKFWSAGGDSVRPVVLWRMQGTCSSTLAIFRKTRQYKQRRQEYSTGFPGETDSSMHHSRIPRQRLRLPFSVCCILSFN